jgi:hypothetical protein
MDRVTLIADEGKIYTNGSAYGVEVYLAVGEDPANWWEIATEEYEALQQEEIF